MFSLLFRRSAMRVSAAALSAQAHVYVRPQLIPIRTFLTASAPRLLPVRATKAKPKASSVTKTKATPKAKAKPKAKTVASKTKAKRPAKKSVAKAKPKPKPKPKKAKPAKPTRVIIPKEDLPPKGKINGYFVFTKEYRVDHPPNEKTLAGNQVLVKEVSAAWNALSEDEKAVYNEKASVVNAAREIEMDKWQQTAKPEVIRELNKRRGQGGRRYKKLRAPGEPAPPMTSWMLFMKDNPIGAKPLSATGTDLHREWFGMHIKAIKAKWDSLSPEEKEAKYVGPARAARQVYLEKKAAYEAAQKEN